MTKNILLTDVDSCLLHNAPLDPKWFSPPYLCFAKAQNYQAFACCTHRSLSSFYLNPECFPSTIKMHDREYNKHQREAAKAGKPFATHCQEQPTETYLAKADTDDFSLSRCIANLKNELRMPFLFVSSAEDSVGDRKCGEGYEQLIKPFEKELLATKKISRKDHQTTDTQVAYIEQNTYYDFTGVYENYRATPHCQSRYAGDDKNIQLLQSIQKLAALYPREELQIDFIDDKLTILQNALYNIRPEDLPPSVSLHIYHHDSFEQTAVTSYGSIHSHHIYLPQRPISLWTPIAPALRGCRGLVNSSASPIELRTIEAKP